jgi:DNA-binding response OmpR family regulator
MSKILLVGNDFRLLTTRAAVLAKTKASVVCCNAIQASSHVRLGESFDLVVLCHSLTRKQAAEVAEMAHQKLSGTKILMVNSNLSWDQPQNGVPLDEVIPADPDGLVRRASELLLQQAIQSVQLPEK